MPDPATVIPNLRTTNKVTGLMGFTVGQQVFATEDIGELLRDRVPKVSFGRGDAEWRHVDWEVDEGVVEDRRPILGDKRIEMTVESDEVAPQTRCPRPVSGARRSTFQPTSDVGIGN